MGGLPQLEQSVTTKHGTEEDAIGSERFLDLSQSPCILPLLHSTEIERQNNVPGRSLTQWRLRHETTASSEFLGIVAKRFSSSPTILSTSTIVHGHTFRCD